ncbi:hypothetical protein BH09MYX1_BH09MYX1_41190 [soil metagenome]
MKTLPRAALAAASAVALFSIASPAQADGTHPEKTWSSALFVDVTTAFVPVANDVPIMLGAGVRFARYHELWIRGGYMPTGDDVRLGFGAIGYRAALRPGKVVRPIFGGLAAGLPETCTHDAARNPTCDHVPLFIVAATAGVRFEPTPWLGLFVDLALGIDSYPNPFGMVEGGVSFALPLS